jgi:hypothetical protein
MCEGGCRDSIEEFSITTFVLGNFVKKIRTGDDGFTRAWVDQRRKRPDPSPMDTVYLSERRVQILDEEEAVSRVESRAIGDRSDEYDELI